MLSTAHRRRLGALLVTSSLAAALTLSGCAVQGAATPAPVAAGDDVSERNPGSYAALPIPDGQIDRAVDALPGLVRAAMADTQVPGVAVGVTYRGKTVFAQGFGVRRVGSPGAVDADTVFQLASLSKSVGATVTAREVSKGVLTWDTPVSAVLPGFALADPWVTQHLTIADLYSHRSGLPDHAGDDLEEIGYGRAEVLKRLRLAPLSPFRTTYQYTNFGITAAGEAVAAASGVGWETLSERELYAPLGMTSTSSRFADFMARTNRASGHVRDSGTWQPTFQRQPDAQSPAGGVSSSVNDLTKWMALLLGDGTVGGDQLIKPDALTPALSPEMLNHPAPSPDARAGFYGFGFNAGTSASGRTVLSHSGAFALGAGTAFALLPSADVGIVVLTNAAPVGAAERVVNQFLDLVQYGEPTFDWPTLTERGFAPFSKPFGALAGKQPPASPAPARRDSAYTGTYRNTYYGDATVTAGPGGLALVIGPSRIRYPLTHWDGDTFTFALRSENAEPGSVSKVTFSNAGRGAGAATRMVVEYFDQYHLGTFTR